MRFCSLDEGLGARWCVHGAVYNARLPRSRKLFAGATLICGGFFVSDPTSPTTYSITPAVDWQRRATIARWVVASSYVLLLVAIAVGTLLWPGRGREPSIIIWVIQTLPLLIVLPGVVRAGVTAHAWLSFIAMLYFAVAVTNLPIASNVELPPVRILDVLELIFSVEIFVGAMLYVRWRSRAVRAASVAQEP
jgi:uncharacterized membrane protein